MVEACTCHSLQKVEEIKSSTIVSLQSTMREKQEMSYDQKEKFFEKLEEKLSEVKD
jgi:hypothetical protein